MTTYSISLDDVDLALLPLRSHKYNDFLKKDHFQFQIMKADVTEDPEPTILCTCHICAIQVPAAFAREHTTSIKHRANARIASVAAERTRALITALPPPTCAQPAARFCANCATVVGRNHEKTKEHRVAVMHDKLLWELMTAYVGNDDDDDENYDSDYSEPKDISPEIGTKKETGSQYYNGFGTCDTIHGKEEKQKYDSTVALKTIEAKRELNKNEVKEDDQYKDDKDNTNVDNNTKHDNTAITDNIETSNRETEITPTANYRRESPVKKIEPITKGEQNPTAIKPKKSDNIESSSRETEFTPNNQNSPARKTEPITEGEQYPTSIKPKVKNHQDIQETETSTNLDTPYTKPKATENIKIEYIEFLTKDHKQVKVFSDYYHSFTRKVETINCIVCSSTFKNDEVDSHMFSLKHLNKMPSTLIDEHCVRPINDTYSHCILCNQMVKNSNVTKHYLTIGHGQREKQAVTDTNQATTSKIGKTVNRDVAPANIDVNANVRVKPKTTEIAKNALNEAKSSVDWPVIYPFEVTEQENTVRCVICDCRVPNNPDNRKGHLVGGNHAKNVQNKRNLYPYENTDRDGVARCIICDVKVTISPENLKEHLTGLNHAKNVIIRKDPQRASASKAPVSTIQTTQQANKTLKRTFESASDTISAKRGTKDYYFSWI